MHIFLTKTAMNFRLKYSEKMYNLISSSIGRKLLISVNDFREFFNVPNMKTPSSLVQKIIETTKAEFDQTETINFNFEIQKKFGKVEYFIFYPYNNVPKFYTVPKSEESINNQFFEETLLEKNIEERIEQVPQKIESNIHENITRVTQENTEENSTSEFEDFEKISTPNFENFNSEDIQSALERMKNIRHNDTNNFGG